jgi:hypothetical protein
MSAAIVTGAYAQVSSALNYWTGLALSNGYSADAYLNTPVGTNSLSFGRKAFKNLSAWNTPDGINGILAWTAVPATDANDGLTVSTPAQLTGSTAFKSFARVDVGNAIAAVEGYVAINYLLKHHTFQIIDANHDGVVTAQELQNFVDNSKSMGLPEAGAMARLLGGTGTYGPVEAGINNTIFNENPDQPAALQRRFNFFDFAANGQLNGGITINEFRMLAHTLLPTPDAFTIIDRSRASRNGFLLAPTVPRNFVNLQHLTGQFLYVPKNKVSPYRGLSPARFGSNRGLPPGTFFPLYTLFTPPALAAGITPSSSQNEVISATKTGSANGSTLTVSYFTAVSPTPTAAETTAVATTASSSPSSSGDGAPASSAPTMAVSLPAVSSTGPSTPSTSSPTGTSAGVTMPPLTAIGPISQLMPNSVTPAGTVTPTSTTTGGTGSGTAAGSGSAPPSTGGSSPSSSPTAASTTTTAAGTTTTAAASSAQAQTAPAPQKHPKAPAKKTTNAFKQIWNDLKKSF